MDESGKKGIKKEYENPSIKVTFPKPKFSFLLLVFLNQRSLQKTDDEMTFDKKYLEEITGNYERTTIVYSNVLTTSTDSQGRVRVCTIR